MANGVSCACGWRARGTEEELTDALARHTEEAHGEKTSRESVASEIEGGSCDC
jgi:predicted small metal-binding protein